MNGLQVNQVGLLTMELKIKGLPVFTVVNGTIVMQNSEIISSPIGKPVLFNYD